MEAQLLCILSPLFLSLRLRTEIKVKLVLSSWGFQAMLSGSFRTTCVLPYDMSPSRSGWEHWGRRSLPGRAAPPWKGTGRRERLPDQVHGKGPRRSLLTVPLEKGRLPLHRPQDRGPEGPL